MVSCARCRHRRPQHHQGRHAAATGTSQPGAKSLTATKHQHCTRRLPITQGIRPHPHDVRDAARHRCQRYWDRGPFGFHRLWTNNLPALTVVGAHSRLQRDNKERPGQPGCSLLCRQQFDRAFRSRTAWHFKWTRSRPLQYVTSSPIPRDQIILVHVAQPKPRFAVSSQIPLEGCRRTIHPISRSTSARSSIAVHSADVGWLSQPLDGPRCDAQPFAEQGSMSPPALNAYGLARLPPSYPMTLTMGAT